MKTVAVLFGGKSTEHDVSIITAIASIIKPLELTKKYKVLPVYISKDGSWYSDDKFADVANYQSGEVENLLRKLPKLKLLFDDGLKLVKNGKKLSRSEVVDVDVVFTAMHGTYGEDGALMGLLDMANVPYVGCDLQSSVIAMDKILAKLVASNAGLQVVPDVTFTKKEFEETKGKLLDKIEKKLGYPAFVKPPHLGSSIGVTKVLNRKELEDAIEVALHYDANVLIEMAVPNLREATLPIIGNGDDITPALLEEPAFQPGDFFDFETKYLQGGKKGKKGGTKMGANAEQGAQGYSRIPANFPSDLYKKAEAVAIAGYKAAGCTGIARVDILINEKTGVVYFNEINPLPGSLYAHNWNKAGVSNVELVDKLVQLAEARWQEKQKLSTGFDTSFLKQF